MLSDLGSAMGKVSLRPSWTKNLGTLIAEGHIVRAWCDTCKGYRDVDLVKLAEIKGLDYDLWGRRTRCRLTPGCNGWNSFMHGGRGPLKNMRDPL